MKEITEKISELFTKWSSNSPKEISLLPSSGSYRKYFRCSDDRNTAIAAWNEDIRENKAFLSFTSHFLSKGLHVPGIYGINAGSKCYLLQDLGDVTLHQFLFRRDSVIMDTDENRKLYEDVLRELVKFQVLGNEGLDYSLCYPRPAFDAQSMQWDLNYFKYNFLKFMHVLFDEQKLEDDFQKLIPFLLQTNTDFFMYRDFQSRNIMIHHNLPYFIDYHGGRKGAPQYDLASILFESKTNLPNTLRQHLLQFYMAEISRYHKIREKSFGKIYYGYALMRILQALGAYGFRGLHEQKTLFIQSIPKGIDNLNHILQKLSGVIDLSELNRCAEQLNNIKQLKYHATLDKKLTVTVVSFSYKKQKPLDLTGNGGGFMFDCRSLPNPGRYSEYKTLTGKDQSVIQFLEKSVEVEEFLNHAFAIIDKTVENYLERNFSNLMVSFGCTGGQHRSVYSAEQLKKHLNHRNNIYVKIQHLELPGHVQS